MRNFFLLLLFCCFFFGMCLNSVAFCYQYTLTSEDAYKIADYFVPENNNYANIWKSNINSILTYWGSQVEVSLVRIDKYNNHIDFYYLGLDKNQITSVSNVNNDNYMSITYTGSAVYRYQGYHGSNVANTQSSDNNYSVGTYNMGSGSQSRTYYILYNNDLTSSVIGPYQSLPILEFTPPVLFEIDINTDSNTQYVSETIEGQTLSNIPIINTQSFGEFFDNTWVSYQAYLLEFWYWNSEVWQKKELFLNVMSPGGHGIILLEDNNYMNFTYYRPTNVDYEEVGLYIKTPYNFSNVIFHFQVIGGNNESADGYFILKDENTSILNGQLDKTKLGDNYLEQFNNLDNMINNNDNTQNIINSITDDSEVDGLLTDFFSGDLISGDGSKFSYHNYYKDFNDNYWGVVNSIIDCFYYSGDPYIDIEKRDGDIIRIYASEYTTPVTPMKVFICSVLIYLYIVIIYEVQRKWILEITEGNLYVLHHADADEYFYM